MILRARDLMQKNVSTVSADMSLSDFANFLDDEGIHGAPVLGSDGHVIGVASYTDLIREVSEEEREGNHNYFRVSDYGRGEYEGEALDLEADFHGSSRLVSEIMTIEVVMAEEETTAGELASTMMERGVHRVLIGTEGVLSGIITSTDLLKAVKKYEEFCNTKNT